MITYYKPKFVSNTNTSQLVTNRWSITNRTKTNYKISIPSESDIQPINTNDISSIRILPPLRVTRTYSPITLFGINHAIFPNNLLSIVKNNNGCSVSDILDSVEQLLGSDNDTESIQLTANQLSFVANLLNIKLNNKTSTMLIKEPC